MAVPRICLTSVLLTRQKILSSGIGDDGVFEKSLGSVEFFPSAVICPVTAMRSILERIAIILSSLLFYAQAYKPYKPSIKTLMNFLDQRDFALHDIAALAARSRDNRARQGDFLFVRRDSPLMADTAWS